MRYIDELHMALMAKLMAKGKYHCFYYTHTFSGSGTLFGQIRASVWANYDKKSMESFWKLITHES